MFFSYYGWSLIFTFIAKVPGFAQIDKQLKKKEADHIISWVLPKMHGYHHINE